MNGNTNTVTAPPVTMVEAIVVLDLVLRYLRRYAQDSLSPAHRRRTQ